MQTSLSPDRLARGRTTSAAFFGDKAYGLLVADAIGLPVPLATVVGRNTAPFRFGDVTGTGEVWLSTCPSESVPGHYLTRKGWADRINCCIKRTQVAPSWCPFSPKSRLPQPLAELAVQLMVVPTLSRVLPVTATSSW